MQATESMEKLAETTQMNRKVLDRLEAPQGSQLRKEAEDAIHDYTRTKMREDGFVRRGILPPLDVSDSDLDRAVEDDKPSIIVDKEPDSPAAMSVPFNTMPPQFYMDGPRYRVPFDRIMTRNHQKDLDELRTYRADIKQIFMDNAVKDILVQEDARFIYAVNHLLVGPNDPQPAAGATLWTTTSEAITRETLADSRTVMRKTSARLSPKTALLNFVTIEEIAKFARDEIGGDLAQDIFVNGITSVTSSMNGLTYVITIKRDLVADGTIHYFAEPKYLGKHYRLYDATMYMETKAKILHFFAFQCSGLAIGNVAGLSRTDFGVVASS